MAKSYAEFIIRHKGLTVLLNIVAIAAMGYGAQFLTFTNDYRVFFGEDNPQLLAFEDLQDTYSKDDNVMFLLVPRSGDVFSNDTLQAVAWVIPKHAPTWLLPGASNTPFTIFSNRISTWVAW